VLNLTALFMLADRIYRGNVHEFFQQTCIQADKNNSRNPQEAVLKVIQHADFRRLLSIFVLGVAGGGAGWLGRVRQGAEGAATGGGMKNKGMSPPFTRRKIHPRSNGRAARKI
jgi:hypothetical protein